MTAFDQIARCSERQYAGLTPAEQIAQGLAVQLGLAANIGGRPLAERRFGLTRDLWRVVNDMTGRALPLISVTVDG